MFSTIWPLILLSYTSITIVSAIGGEGTDFKTVTNHGLHQHAPLSHNINTLQNLFNRNYEQCSAREDIVASELDHGRQYHNNPLQCYPDNEQRFIKPESYHRHHQPYNCDRNPLPAPHYTCQDHHPDMCSNFNYPPSNPHNLEPRNFANIHNDQSFNPNTSNLPKHSCYINSNQNMIPNAHYLPKDQCCSNDDQRFYPNPMFLREDHDYNYNDANIKSNPNYVPRSHAYNKSDQKIMNPNPCYNYDDYCYSNNNNGNVNLSRSPQSIREDYAYNNNAGSQNLANVYLENRNPRQERIDDRIDDGAQEINRTPQILQWNANTPFGIANQASSPSGDVIYNNIQEQRKTTEINYGPRPPNPFQYSAQANLEANGKRFQETSKTVSYAEVPRVVSAVGPKATVIADGKVNAESNGQSCCIPKSIIGWMGVYCKDDAADLCGAACSNRDSCSDGCDPAGTCDYCPCYPNHTHGTAIQENRPETDNESYRGFAVGVSKNRILGNANDSDNKGNEHGEMKEGEEKDLKEGDVVGEFRGRILYAKQGVTLSVDYLSLPNLDKQNNYVTNLVTSTSSTTTTVKSSF